jgi:hypothetical protein
LKIGCWGHDPPLLRLQPAGQQSKALRRMGSAMILIERMSNLFSLYVWGANKLILLLFVASICMVTHQGFDNEVFQGVLLSIIIGSVFYYIDSYLPEMLKKKNELSSIGKYISDEVLGPCSVVGMGLGLDIDKKIPLKSSDNKISSFISILKTKYLSEPEVRSLIDKAYKTDPSVTYGKNYEKLTTEQKRDFHILTEAHTIESNIRKIIPAINSPELKTKLSLLTSSKYLWWINYLQGASKTHEIPAIKEQLLKIIPIHELIKFNSIVIELLEYILLYSSTVQNEFYSEKSKHKSSSQ